MFRISNGFRVIEDAVGFVAGSAARKVARGAHAVSIEYRARQLANHARSVSKQVRKLDALSPAEQAELAREHAEVTARANELLRGKL